MKDKTTKPELAEKKPEVLQNRFKRLQSIKEAADRQKMKAGLHSH